MEVLGFTLASFGLFLLLHWLVWRRLGPKKGVFLLIQLAGAVFLISAFTLSQLFSLSTEPIAFSAAPLYAFFLIFYLHFYVGMDRSVSIRIMGELVESPHHRLSKRELDRSYNKSWMIQSRIELLEETGWLSKSKGLYVCSPKGKSIAKFARWVRRLYGLKIAG